LEAARPRDTVRPARAGSNPGMAIRGRFGEASRPATLGSTLAAHLCLIVWCKACRHQVEPDVAEQVERYGAGLALPDWAARLVCSKCGRQEVDFVVSGSRR
jgi:hypothetical protein